MNASPATLVTAMLPRYMPLPNEPSAFCVRASQARPFWMASSVSGVIISAVPSGTSPRRASPNPFTDLLGSDAGVGAWSWAVAPIDPPYMMRAIHKPTELVGADLQTPPDRSGIRAGSADPCPTKTGISSLLQGGFPRCGYSREGRHVWRIMQHCFSAERWANSYWVFGG